MKRWENFWLDFVISQMNCGGESFKMQLVGLLTPFQIRNDFCFKSAFIKMQLSLQKYIFLVRIHNTQILPCPKYNEFGNFVFLLIICEKV